MKPSKSAIFSRRFACLMFQPYVFSLAFALMEIYLSKYKTSFSADNMLLAFESKIHPFHKPTLRTKGIRPNTWRTVQKRESKKAQSVTGTEQIAIPAKTEKEIH